MPKVVFNPLTFDELQLLEDSTSGTGPQGPPGPEGEPGADGEPGPPGSTGATGATGAPGADGAQGDKAGLRYNFDTSTVDADPGLGEFRYDSAVLAAITFIFINDNDTSADFHGAFIQTWADSTNAIRGHVIVADNANTGGVTQVFEVLGPIIDGGGYRKVPVRLRSDLTGGVPSAAQPMVINFARAGDVGTPGPAGEEGMPGEDGAPGPTGSTGAAGADGATGATGASGVAGPPGDDGQDGYDGLPGVQGPIGPQGLQGIMGRPGEDGQSFEDAAPLFNSPINLVSGLGASGRIAFWTSATMLGSNPNLFWDDTNTRLGVGTAAPAFDVDVNRSTSGGIVGIRAQNVDGSAGSDAALIAKVFSGAGGDPYLLLSTNATDVTVGVDNTDELWKVDVGTVVGGSTAFSMVPTTRVMRSHQRHEFAFDALTFDNDNVAPNDAQSRDLSILSAVGASTITLSGAFPTLRVLGAFGTVNLTESAGNPLGMGFLLYHKLTYTNDDGLDPGSLFAFIDQPTLNVTTTSGARTTQALRSYNSLITLARAAGANTFTLNTLDHLTSSLAIGTGCAVGTRTGMNIANATGAGTIDTQVAVEVANLTKGGVLNAAVRSAITANSIRYFLKDDGGAQSFLTGKFTTYNALATEGFGLAAILDEVSLPGRTTAIGSTNFTNAGTAGFYRVHWYLVVTTTAAVPTMTVTIGWTDNAAARTNVSAPIAFAATNFAQGDVIVRLNSGSVSYLTTLTGAIGTGVYAFYATCERLV